MRILTLLALAALSGCVTASPLVLPNGHQGQLIRCYYGMADCVTKAGDLCPAGYDIVTYARDSRPYLVASGGLLVGGTVESGSLIVSCH